jgi:hypothetical protein
MWNPLDIFNVQYSWPNWTMWTFDISSFADLNYYKLVEFTLILVTCIILAAATSMEYMYGLSSNALNTVANTYNNVTGNISNAVANTSTFVNNAAKNISDKAQTISNTAQKGITGGKNNKTMKSTYKNRKSS